ncbi:MAG TPA: hypothetical protein VHG29_05310 [Novosphingobium sp.]|nr:hypothetical protein [Novosphingobium sp.]
MTTGSGAIKGAEAAADAARDYAAVRAASDIQFAPVTPPAPDPPPEWLQALGKFLRELFEPLGRALGLSWPTVEWILIGLAVLLVAYILWRLVIQPLLARRAATVAPDEPEWAPDRDAATALLEDADRLAAEGQFDAATHLLLQRSVRHIADTRPDWLHPASTAREIAALEALPSRAREAFAAIATRVERSRFALRSLELGDWQAARTAYADFALAKIG